MRTRDCCERHNDAGQKKRLPAGHADHLNGASSMYYYGAFLPSGQPVWATKQTCALVACP